MSDEQGATITVTAPPAKSDKRTGEQKRIEDLFQAVNPGDSIKIRHELRADQGKHVRPLTAILRDFAGVTDLEQHIYETGCQQGWKTGDYMIELCRPGHQGAVRYGFFSFTFPERPATAVAPPAVDPLAVLERAKGILGPSPQASPDATLAAVTEAMKVGASSAAKPGALDSTTLAMLKPILDKIVDRLMTPAAQQDPLTQMRAMVGALRELGLIGGEGGGDEPKSLHEQIADIKALAETLGLSARGAAPEATAVAVAKIFAPVAEKVVPQVLATINNVVDVWRMRMTLGTAGGVPMAPRAMPAGPPPIPAAVTQLVQATQAAIARDDDGFFGPFVQGIADHVPDGRSFLLAIQGGQVDEEQALTVIGATGLLNPADPATRAWLLRCVHWVQTRKPMPGAPEPAPGPDEVLGRCDKCGAEYKFPGGMAEYQADTRICDAPTGEGESELCKGNIALVEAAQ